ncbi:hypothetical protein evm_002573 [Chilo suppressalis]|nr:hypothetical protein evm_002573 [Chilo suppressalis]
MITGHFLIGRPLNALPFAVLEYLKETSLSRFARLEKKMAEGVTAGATLNVGDLILIHEDNNPPLNWRMGRVTRLKILKFTEFLLKKTPSSMPKHCLLPEPVVPTTHRIMKAFFLVMAVLAPLVLCYDEKYDKIDVDKILADEALFDGYIKCLLDKGPCDQENATDFRKLLPEVIATACGKCSPIQKESVRKTVRAITQRKPDQFKEFIAKYDPTREHEAAFSAFVLSTD